MPNLVEAPTDAREMHGNIFSSEATHLPPALVFFLSMILKNNVDIKAEPAQPLLDELEEEILIVREATEEQVVARTLLLRFGLPYLPGAEEVWLTLGEYLANAKEAAEQALFRLRETVDQIQALLIGQLVRDEETQIEALEIEEKQHRQGIMTLQKTSPSLHEENQLMEQRDGAVSQKKDRLTIISIKKKEFRDSIESMRAMVVNLFISSTNIQQLDSTQLVMA